MARSGAAGQAPGPAEPRSLTWLGQVECQHGVVTRQQALEAGLPEDIVDRRLRSGKWQRLHRGVYATFTGGLSRDARLWAAVFYAGPGAALSHETAAELHELVDKPAATIHVSVPAERRPGQHSPLRGVVLHRGRGLAAEPQPPWHLPRTSVEDTVLDLIAAARSSDDAYGWITAAVGRRLTTPEFLGQALSRRSRMRWRKLVTAALRDAADGAGGS